MKIKNLYNKSDKIQPLENQIKELEEKIEASKQNIVQSCNEINNILPLEIKELEEKLIQKEEKLQQILTSQPVEQNGAWNDNRWSQWSPERAALLIQSSEETLLNNLSFIRVGHFNEKKPALGNSISLPGNIPFIGQEKTIIFKTHDKDAHLGKEFLNTVILRSALLLPHEVNFVLLDPAGLGQAFPLQSNLPMATLANSGDIYTDLAPTITQIQNFSSTYLNGEITSFEQLPPDIRLNHKFTLIFAADFPRGYDRRAIEALQRISATGNRAGVYLFIHHNSSLELPREMNLTDFKNTLTISYPDCNIVKEGFDPLIPDIGEYGPQPKFYNNVLTQLRQTKPPERKILYNDFIEISKDNWWSHTSVEKFETPIGIYGANKNLNLWFGKNHNGQECAHAILGGMSGSGKSVTAHVSIVGLCTRYSPDELQFYLIDGKYGAEFQLYHDLPHARLILLHSTAELARNALAELVKEMERRYDLFTSNGVADYSTYRNLDAVPPLPRILMITDEYQIFFENDRDETASNNLLRIAQQGRAAGIHMWLGSQQYGAPGMLHKNQIFSNIHMRMAMQLDTTATQGLVDFGRQARIAISKFDVSGKILLNDQAGVDTANKVGKIAFLPREEVKEKVKQLVELYEKKRKSDQVSQVKPTTTIDGTEQPDFIENPYVEYFLSREFQTWPDETEMASFSNRKVYENGLERFDWYSGEKPCVLWLGKDYEILNQASVILKQKMYENLLITGESRSAIYGMLATSIASLAITNNPDSINLIILDRVELRTPWTRILEEITNKILIPYGYPVKYRRENSHVEKEILKLANLVQERKKMAEEKLLDLPIIFTFITEPYRVNGLTNHDNAFGSSKLKEDWNLILSEGPQVGIHMIAAFSETPRIPIVLDGSRELAYFNHRVLLQMSENDSYTYLGSVDASRLQTQGPKPISAIYWDITKGKLIRFLPYSSESEAFETQFTEVVNRFEMRVNKGK